MGHACIAIGINHYQFLPPLSYGQADAYALRQFFVNQANLPSDQCLLLSDASPLLGKQSTSPTQENIWRHLEAENKNSSSTHYCWFFFSGYGVSWEDVDYLMPIDGNPNDIPGTAIPVRSLFAALKSSSNDNLLVLLDINRSPGLQAGNSVGAETVALAQEMGIALILSSQLEQFSHEAAALGNGLFTAALLEALRYYHTDTTLENLDQYLRVRLPELSQHHWRPIQTPLAVIPSQEARQQLILPTAETPSVAVFSAFGLPTPIASDREENLNGATPVQTTPVSTVEAHLDAPFRAKTSPQTAPTFKAMVPNANREATSELGTPLWRQLLFWGGGATLVLLLMLAAIILDWRDRSISQQAIETPRTQAVPTTSASANMQASSTPVASRLQINQADLKQAKLIIRPNQASLFNQAITQARRVQPSDPLYPQARQDISRWSAVILDLAEGRAAQNNFGEAIRAAQLVPEDDPSVYNKAQQTIATWKISAKQQQQNQAIIQEAKAQLQSNQASSYRRAIIILSKILPNQPRYGEAQQLKAQWSRVIYLIAQSRASQGKFENAIQTAALVPVGTSSYEAAQKAILKWKQGQR